MGNSNDGQETLPPAIVVYGVGGLWMGKRISEVSFKYEDKDNVQIQVKRINGDHEGHWGTYDVTEVLEALGAVRKGRAEELERLNDTQAENNRHFRKKLEESEAEHESTKEAYRQLGRSHAKIMEKLTEAEATIGHVRDEALKANAAGRTGLYTEEILSLLDPKPQFKLPEQVPAKVRAKRDFHDYVDTLTLWTDGRGQFWRSEHNGEDWTSSGVMGCFTEHEVLEDEETA